MLTSSQNRIGGTIACVNYMGGNVLHFLKCVSKTPPLFIEMYWPNNVSTTHRAHAQTVTGSKAFVCLFRLGKKLWFLKHCSIAPSQGKSDKIYFILSNICTMIVGPRETITELGFRRHTWNSFTDWEYCRSGTAGTGTDSRRALGSPLAACLRRTWTRDMLLYHFAVTI